MSWGTAGLAGQVFDGPCCYVESWDMAFQQALQRIAALPSLTQRRAALRQIEVEGGRAARKRMESALARYWQERQQR